MNQPDIAITNSGLHTPHSGTMATNSVVGNQ